MAISRNTSQRKVRQSVDLGLKNYFTNIYTYMGLALGLTGGIAMSIAYGPLAVRAFFAPFSFFSSIALLGLAFYIGFAFERMSLTQTRVLFWSYATLMGIALSNLLGFHNASLVGKVALTAASVFGITSIYGYSTQRDLSSWGSLLFMGLTGILVASIINIFMKSSAFDLMISILGVGFFIGLTAYDTQKLKNLYFMLPQDTQIREKCAVMGALQLYLDVINIFLFLLRIFSRRD
jgi:uncharacterized protein